MECSARILRSSTIYKTGGRKERYIEFYCPIAGPLVFEGERALQVEANLKRAQGLLKEPLEESPSQGPKS
jgi:hypothetical protein